MIGINLGACVYFITYFNAIVLDDEMTLAEFCTKLISSWNMCTQNTSNLVFNVLHMYAMVIHASRITCDRNSFSMSRNDMERLSFRYAANVGVLCTCSSNSERIFFSASTRLSQSMFLSPIIVLIDRRLSSMSRWLNIVNCGTASNNASNISIVTAPASPLCTSSDCGFRMADAVRFTKRMLFGLAMPALSTSSEFDTAELSAVGISSPFIFTSSNFCSKMAIFVLGTSFFRRSTLSLSPANWRSGIQWRDNGKAIAAQHNTYRHVCRFRRVFERRRLWPDHLDRSINWQSVEWNLSPIAPVFRTRSMCSQWSAEILREYSNFYAWNTVSICQVIAAAAAHDFPSICAIAVGPSPWQCHDYRPADRPHVVKPLVCMR